MSSKADLVRKLSTYARCASVWHGPAHWARVHRFGGLLADREGLPSEARTSR